MERWSEIDAPKPLTQLSQHGRGADRLEIPRMCLDTPSVSFGVVAGRLLGRQPVRPRSESSPPLRIPKGPGTNSARAGLVCQQEPKGGIKVRSQRADRLYPGGSGVCFRFLASTPYAVYHTIAPFSSFFSARAATVQVDSTGQATVTITVARDYQRMGTVCK